MDRNSGELLVALKFDPAVNWATHVDMKSAVLRYWLSTYTYQGEDTWVLRNLLGSLGSKDQQPVSLIPQPDTSSFNKPFVWICVRVEYTAGQPYVGATLSMFPAPNSHGGMGNVIADLLKVRLNGLFLRNSQYGLVL